MDVDDIDDFPKPKGEEEQKRNQIVVILVGAPGSGKSTFCDSVMRSSIRSWVRVCQDTINNGKSGTKAQCLKSAVNALKEGKSVFIDRCNLDKDQRIDFVKLGGLRFDVHAVVLDLPAQVCISRSVKRTGHEGNLQGGKAAAVVNKMLQNKQLPTLEEGYSRITFCQNESDVKGALDNYSLFGPTDILPNGCFGKQKSDPKVQLGIMKFFKKMDAPSKIGCENTSCREEELVPSLSCHIKEDIKEDKDPAIKYAWPTVSSESVPTLAFPSISTADFQFNIDKASDIIVEKVEELVNKIGNARVVFVDLKHGSKILSLVRTKAAQRSIDPEKFFTFVGDITQLFSKGGLHCNVIANAANWRLKPGGGGVNAAIFSAAGPALEDATKDRAITLKPGNAVVVPLPSHSPLYSKEKVSHVIHVLGPNMNPQRPDCLNDDYTKGCKILRDAYTSLFDCFLSTVAFPMESSENLGLEPSKSVEPSQASFVNKQTLKRDVDDEYGRSKKCRGVADKVENDGSRTREWGHWAQVLHRIAINPEKHMDIILDISDDAVVINDAFPKAQKHVLVVSRWDGVDCLADVCKDHVQLLTAMHAIGLKWAEKCLLEDPSLAFRLGYHSEPSMRQLHLHVISQDFNSKHLKNKKHWNSFNTPFFRDSVDVMEDINNLGKATIKDEENLLTMELRCNRCRSAHPNVPRLKSHIGNCQVPFPTYLLENGRLLLAESNTNQHL